MRTVTAIFKSHEQAVDAAGRVKAAGLKTDDISVIAPNNRASGHYDNDEITDGTVTGSVLGGAIGLLAGIGAVAIPGVGAIAAAGPIAGLITGTVTGGLVGALVDLGIPEHEAREYNQLLSQGKTIWSMKVTDEKYNEVKDLLLKCGAERV